MRSGILFTALLGLVLLAGSQATSADKKAASKSEKGGVKCLISGKAASGKFTATFKGKKVCFCCEKCVAAFNKSPAKFSTKAYHQLASTGQLNQIACPISGGKIDSKVSLDVQGVKVSFCCKKCVAKVAKAEGAAQLELVYGKINKGFTVQAKCPVSGKDLNAKFSINHAGEKVYFCCEKCLAAFKKNPDKFASKVPQLTKD